MASVLAWCSEGTDCVFVVGERGAFSRAWRIDIVIMSEPQVPTKPATRSSTACARSTPVGVVGSGLASDGAAPGAGQYGGAGRMFTPAGLVLFTSYYQRARQLHGPALLPLLRHSLRCCAPHASGGSASGTVELGPSEAGETDPGC